MAENDVTVTIGVDTSGLDAGMARVKEATQGLGGALATSSERAASGFERMVGRMLTRLGIFYVIHEAIKLITEVLQESSAYEAAQVRFENLSVAVEGSAKAWEHLRQVAHETGISQEELGQAQMSLEKMGVSGGQVGGVMENLAKYAKILGVDVGTVAQEFGRVELRVGSIKDMQDLAYATHDINLQQLVNNLAETQRMAPIVAQQQAEIDRQINRAAEDTDRLRQAQIGVAQALHLSGQAYQEFIGGGRAGGVGGQLTSRLRSELAVGARQLAAEGEPTVQQMRSMGVSGKEIYQILMQAAERYHERVREMMRRQEEDARENVRLKAAQALKKAEDQVAEAIQAGIGADTAFAKVMDTAAGFSDLIKEHMKEIVDDAIGITDAIKGWNTAILGFVDNIKNVGKELEPVIQLAQQLVSVIGQAAKAIGFDIHKPPSEATQVWSPTHKSAAEILRSMPFGIGNLALPQGGQNPVVQKLNEQDKQHETTHGILRDMLNVLYGAFGP